MTIGAADSIAVPTVRRIGRKRTTQLSMIASKSGPPLAQRQVDEIDDDDRLARDDAGEGNHPDHRGRGKERGVRVWPNLPAGKDVEQPETRHDADHRQRDREHDDDRQAE